MIVTLTPNPSLDRTVEIDELRRGEVHRATGGRVDPGGKGVNVSRALAANDIATVAVLPSGGPEGAQLAALLAPFGVQTVQVPISGTVRSNITVAEPDGTTTKLNEVGPELSPEEAAAVERTVVELAPRASWVVGSGSLPRGLGVDFYARLTTALRGTDTLVCIDASGPPLAAAIDAGPDLIKPNAEELASVLGHSPEALEAAVAQGDPEPVVAAARQLVDRGVGAVLATLGAAGAVLVDETGSWLATPPPITARSTVGAGDASLAGYLRADVGGAVPPQRLQMAVAYGSAAAALPGSALPTPGQIDLNAVRVTPIAPISPTTNTKVSP